MKTIKKSNFRVVVYPRTTAYGFIVADNEDRCKEIEAEINRHVDNVAGVGIESDTDTVCEYCKSLWTEDSDTYNGGCCDADQTAEEDRIAADRLCDETEERSVVAAGVL